MSYKRLLSELLPYNMIKWLFDKKPTYKAITLKLLLFIKIIFPSRFIRSRSVFMITRIIFLYALCEFLGPMVYWPTIMANTSTNNTSAENGEVVVLQVNEHNHHSWRYNILILRAWLGSCLALGLLIGLILIVLIWSFLWKKYHVPFKRYFGVKSQDCKKDYDQRQFEMQDIETQACFLENTVH